MKYFENDNNVLLEKFTVSLVYLFFFGSMRFAEISSIIRTILHLLVQPVPGGFPPTSSKISDQSASRSMQNFGGPFHVRNVLTTCIICLTRHEMLIQ